MTLEATEKVFTQGEPRRMRLGGWYNWGGRIAIQHWGLLHFPDEEMPLEPRPLEPPPFRSTPTSDTQRRSTKAFKFPRRDDLSASDAPVHVPQNAFGLKDPRSSERFCAENLAAVFAAESTNNVRDLEQELKVSAEAEMQRSGADDVKDRVSNLTKTITGSWS